MCFLAWLRSYAAETCLPWSLYTSSVRCRVACAPYGGPVALVRDDRKIVPVTGGATKPVITTYTAAGVRLGAFVWERSRIMGLAWTSEEDLMLLAQSGEARPRSTPHSPVARAWLPLTQRRAQVHLYSMHGQAQARSFSLGSEVAREGVAACCLYGSGLVALTVGLQLWAVTDLEEPRPQRLADPRLPAPPHCLTIIQPRHTLSGCIEARARRAAAWRRVSLLPARGRGP